MDKDERQRRLDFIGQLYPGYYAAPPVYCRMTDEQLAEALRLATAVKLARRDLECFAQSTDEGHNGEIPSKDNGKSQ